MRSLCTVSCVCDICQRHGIQLHRTCSTVINQYGGVLLLRFYEFGYARTFRPDLTCNRINVFLVRIITVRNMYA